MARTHVSVIGLGNLRRELRELDDEIQRGALRAVEESARAVQSEGRDTIRVRTGRARDKLKVRVRASGLSADVGWSDPDVYYVKFLEWGTEKIEAIPVLTMAAENERRRFPDRVARHVRQEAG